MTEGRAPVLGRLRRPATPARPARLAVLAVLAAVLGAFLWSLALAVSHPPWAWPDERSHTGYASALAHHRVPDLETPIRRLDHAPNLDLMMDANPQDNYVWVSNHPPGGYVFAVPGTWVAHRTGRGRLVIASLRAGNALGAALAVGVTALAARELTGSRRAAVLAAGFTAAAPHLLGVSSRGMTDGVSLAASLTAIWAATRIVRRGLDPPTIALSAAALAACGLTRIAALSTGVLVLGLALLWHAVRDRRLPWRAALAVGLPALVTSGWFYLRNIVRYGDPAASSELLERFNRTPRGSVVGVLSTWSGDVHQNLPGGWREVVGKALTTFDGEPSVVWFPPHPPAPRTATAVVLLSVLAAALLLAARFVVARVRGRTVPGAGPVGWALLAVAVAGRFVTTAQHISGGGLAHPRYLLLLVPAGACVVAAALDVACGWSRVARVGALLAVTTWIGWSALTASDLEAHGTGSVLPTPRLGPVVAGTALMAGAVAAMTAYVVLASVAVLRPAPEPEPAPAGGREVDLARP